MSKNMTRKGLAFGAGLSLIATGFAGVPASAAVDDNAVSLLPRTGTQYGGFIDNVYDLKTTTSLAASGGSGSLKYKVVDEDLELRWDFDSETPDAGTTDYSINQTALEADDLTITGATTSSATLTFRTQVVRFLEDQEITISSADVDTFSISLTNATSGGQIAISAADQVDSDKEIVTISVTDGLIPASVASMLLSDLASAGVPDNEIADGVKSITATTDSDSDGFLESFTFTIDDETSASQAAQAISAGSAIFTLDANFNGLLNGNHTVSADVRTSGSESFSIVLDDSANDYLANFVYDVKAITIASKAGGAHSDSLDSYAILTADTSPFAAPAVSGLAYSTVDADDTFIINTALNVDGTTTQYLRLASTSTNTHSVDVTAWIDENGNDEIDPTENSSSTRTITFYKWADSGATLNIETPVAGEDWEVSVAFNASINASQITNERLEVALGVLDAGALEAAAANQNVNGTDTAFTAPTDAFLVWDSASHVEDFWGLQAQVSTTLTSDDTGASNFTAGYTYAGQIWLDNAALGNVVYTGTGAAVADDIGAIAATRGDNVLQSGSNVKVRTEYTGSVEFKVLLTEDDATIAGNPTGAGTGKVAVPAGTEVTVEVAEGSGDLDADSTVTVNGEALTNGDDPIEFTVLTDSNGYATFTLSNDEGAAGDDLDLTVTHAGTAQTAGVTWNDATASSSVLFGATSVSVEAEDTWSITYTALDEFGAALAGADYRVEAQYYDEVGGTQKTAGVQLDANGQGTLTVVDASEASGAYAVNADLQELNTSAAYVDFGAIELDSTVYIGAAATPANITLVDSGTGIAIELVPGVTTDTRIPNSGLAPNYSATEHFTITGVVTNAAGNAVRGTPVTVSAPGLLFNTGTHATTASSGNYTVDSITVTTSATGSYSVEVRSNLAGDHVVTVAAGSATETETLTFEEALATTGANLVIDAPASVGAGSSFTVKVSLKDAFGNPVETSGTSFNLTYSGAGIALNIPSNTNDLGEASFAVLLGANDTGIGTITATYDADSTATTVDNNYSVTRTVNGASADAKVNAGSFLGYVAVYAKGHNGSSISWKIAGKWFKTTITSDYQVFQRKTIDVGADVNVDIYIDGVKQLSKVVTTR